MQNKNYKKMNRVTMPIPKEIDLNFHQKAAIKFEEKKVTHEVSCDLCGSKDSEFCFSNYDRMFPEIEGSFDIYKCKECGLMFLNPQPSPDELLKHYNSGYSVFSDSNEIADMRKVYSLLETLYHCSDLKGKAFKWGKFLLLPLKPFLRTTKVVEKGNFLDVGCGIGNFVFIMKYLGMNAYGIEPGNFDKKFSEDYNLNIFQGELFEAKFDDNFFDVITLNHVLEHVSNPAETMQELYRILNKGGHLIIAVPITDSFAFKLFGKYWAQLDTPRHLFLFSIDNLKDYAEHAGFEIDFIRYNSTPSFQLISSLIYLMEQRKGRKYNRMIINNFLLNFLLLPITAILNILKCGDQCEIVLRKK